MWKMLFLTIVQRAKPSEYLVISHTSNYGLERKYDWHTGQGFSDFGGLGTVLGGVITMSM